MGVKDKDSKNISDSEMMEETTSEEKQDIPLDGFLDDNEPTAKWDTKASVFNNLFSEVEYRFRLYQALHPEDKATIFF